MNTNTNTAKIVDIKPVGERRVYDLDVAIAHNYVANGILVHNCSYHDILDYYGKKYNEEFYKIKDTFVTYKHRRILFYPAGPNKKTLRGRCLIGSTLINTEYGFIKLNELIQEDGQLELEPSFSVDTHLGKQTVTHTYKESVSKTIKITTDNGYVIQGTPEHPIYVKNKEGEYDWYRLDTLEVGQHIKSISDTQNPIWSNISEVEEDVLQTIVENINEIGDYPIEVRTSSKKTNEIFIDLLIINHAVFTDSKLVLDLYRPILEELQVILLHGFGLVTNLNETGLILSYFSMNTCGLLENLQNTNRIVGRRNPKNNKSNDLSHTEIISNVEIVEEDCDVFDITVPVGHAFLANGMVSHNTRILCLTGDTLVSTDKGLQKIENNLLGLTSHNQGVPTKIVGWAQSGKKEVFKVTLDSGHSITGSKDHKIRVLSFESSLEFEVWKSIEDLKTSDYVILSLGGLFPEQLEFVGFKTTNRKLPKEMTVELAEFLGKCINDSIDHLELFSTYRATEIELKRFLNFIGLKSGKIPWVIKQAPKLCVESYVDTVTKLYAKKYEDSFALNSNPEFIAEFQILLSTLNVFSKIVNNTIVFKKYKNRKMSVGVSSVVSLGSKDTYDISVDNDIHAFTANGICVKNSSVDEIGWFDNQNDGKVKMDATQVYVALDRSLLTVRAAARRLLAQGFDDIPNGFAFNVSSPSSARDKIVELVAQSKNSKKIFGFKRATWDMNPNITKDDLSEEFAKNPIDAERDYGCNPPLSDNAFIPSFQSIEGCFIGKPNKLRYKHSQKTMRDGTVTRYAIIDEIAKSTKANILAIDAGYCVTGDTIVTTEFGLRRIDSLVDLPLYAKEGYKKDINLKVGSRFETAVAKTWHYKGIKPTLKLKTESGHTLCGTANHLQLIFRKGDYVWVKLSDIKIGDLACFNPIQPIRNVTLALDLPDVCKSLPKNNTSGVHGVYKMGNSWAVILYLDGIRTSYGRFKDFAQACEVRNKIANKYGLDSGNTSSTKVTKPTTMTPDLAYFIGAIISEGHFNKYTIGFSNSNKKYLAEVSRCADSVFGLKCKKHLISKAGVAYTINGRTGITKKTCYQLEWYSGQVCSWLQTLGLVPSTTGTKTSYIKTIPDCILQADSASQLAFLAAYIEGDGQVYPDRYCIAIWSKSKKILASLQLLLNAYGVMTNIRKDSLSTASSHDAVLLFDLIKGNLQHKKHNIYKKIPNKVGNRFGAPADFISDFLVSRKKPSHATTPTKYLSDNGEYVYGAAIAQNVNKLLCYDKYEQGGYDFLLESLKTISESFADKVENVLKLKYRYSPIIKVTQGKRKRVYDLSMTDGEEPAYTANGMIIHNTGNSFAAVCAHLHEGLPIISCAIEVMPNPGMPLNHALIFREALHTIIKERNVKLLLADRWQSIKLLQDAELEFDDLIAHQYSLRYDDFWIIKQTMFDSEVIFPKLKRPIEEVLKFDQSKYPYCLPDPMEHLAVQCVTVRDMGNSIDKGDGLTDDIFRASCLAIYGLQSEKYSELFDNDYGEEDRNQIAAIGYMAGRSGGATTSNEVHVSKSGQAIGVMFSKR